MAHATALQITADAEHSTFADDVAAGLSATPKRLSPKYFYDARGAVLFDQITEQPEYYPTRAEIAILRQHAAAITDLFPPSAALVEFGAGSSRKARVLLAASDRLAAYVPVDIAAEWLHHEAAGVARDFPHLQVLPVAADFMTVFALPETIAARPRVGFFPGSTIGNLEPPEAKQFLQRVAATLGFGATLIVGVDLVKDSATLDAAYNDAAGVTAAFNLNVLTRINRELAGNFDLSAFAHRAFFNRGEHRIEMHLASQSEQHVRIGKTTYRFHAGESIHTENSYKYSIESFQTLARQSGWTPIAVWTDADSKFSVHAFTLSP